MSDEQQSSTPKFREGDVVLCTPQRVDGMTRTIGVSLEGIVDKVTVDRIHGDFASVRGCGIWGFAAMTLLRRPVREGDVLRSDGASGPRTVSKLCEPGDRHWIETSGGSYTLEYGLKHLVHENGTPIEPPQKTSGDKASGVFDSPPAAVPSTSCRPEGPKETGATPCRECERMAKRLHAEAMKSMAAESQLADVRSLLASSNVTMEAAGEEIDFLKREVKRLDPRLYRARYERNNGR